MSEDYQHGPHTVYDIQYHTEKMIAAYIEQQEKPPQQANFRVDDE